MFSLLQLLCARWKQTSFASRVQAIPKLLRLVRHAPSVGCLATIGLGMSMSSCSLLAIGSDTFACQEPDAQCVNASTYLQQQQQLQVLTVPQYYELNQTLLQAQPNTQQLLNPYSQGYLQIWFAPYRIQHKLYNSSLLLIPYLH